MLGSKLCGLGWMFSVTSMSSRDPNSWIWLLDPLEALPLLHCFEGFVHGLILRFTASHLFQIEFVERTEMIIVPEIEKMTLYELDRELVC